MPHPTTACARRLWLTLVLLALPAAVHADYYYHTATAGAVTITGYTGFGGALVIPSTIDGLPVTSIGDWAFYNCQTVTSVTIPDSVTSIRDVAFFNCPRLTSITVGAGVTSIGYCAFGNCTSLSRADFAGNAPSMGGTVFDGYAPGFVVHYVVGRHGFTSPSWQGYPSVAEPNTPRPFTFGGVTEAGLGATCISRAITVAGIIASVPISVAGGEYAVSTDGGATWSAFSTSSPRTVSNGDQVKLRVTSSADADAAVNVTLVIGTVRDTWTVVGRLELDFAVSDLGTGIQVTGYHGRGRAVAIPATIHGKPVTAIGRGAFEHRNLTSITIPATVTSIGNNAFHGCTYLTSVTIPEGVTSLGASAFSGCTGLTGAIIPASVTTIGDGAFFECAGLTSITIPDSVTSLGSAAFYGCRGLTRVAIGNRVGSIGSRTFWDCSRLLSINIPDSVTSIDEWAFWNCTSLTSAALGSHVATIEGLAFANCTSLTSITIPDSVTGIGNMAFEDCSSLASVAIGRSVTSLGQRAFAGCASLTSVSIPDSVARLDYAAFMDCSRLAGVTIGSGVTSIGQQAFGGCPNLTSADFRGNAPVMDLAVFLGCAASFTVYHIPGKKGFTSPKWNGHPSTIRATRPDFVITDIRLDPPVPVRGGTFTACVTVQNVGTKAPHGASLLAWVDWADDAPASLPADQAATVCALKSGQLQIVRFSALSAGADGGPYVFRAFVDAAAQTAETDETNNQRTLTWHAGRPDFVVTAVSFSPNPPVAGKTFAASVTVQNIGDSPGDAGSVDVWVNGRCEVPPSPGLRGDKTAGAGTLLAGQQKTLTFTSLAAPTDDAAQEFLAIVDSRTRTSESNETNNALIRSFLPARPDFIITAIELAPEPVICGQTFTAYVTVQNAGTAAGSAGYLHVWLDRVAASEPELNTHGDKYAPVGTLAPGQEKRLTFTSLRASPSPQRRILRVCADYRNQTVEASDTNNESAREYSCAPSP